MGRRMVIRAGQVPEDVQVSVIVITMWTGRASVKMTHNTAIPAVLAMIALQALNVQTVIRTNVVGRFALTLHHALSPDPKCSP